MGSTKNAVEEGSCRGVRSIDFLATQKGFPASRHE